MAEIAKKFYERTDNKFLPNAHSQWEQFHWWMHFLGGRCLVAAWHFSNKEIKHAKESSKS